MVLMMWMSLYHPGNEKITFYGFLLQLIFYSLFQIQGTFNQCMHDEITGDLYKIRDSKWSVIIAGLGFYSFGIFWTGTTSNVGLYVLYPYYMDPVIRMLKIVGSWMLIYFGILFMTVKSDYPYDKKVNDLINKSSMWAYLSHPFWQNVAMTFLYKYELTYWPLTTIVHLFTLACVLISYGPLSKTGLI